MRPLPRWTALLACLGLAGFAAAGCKRETRPSARADASTAVPPSSTSVASSAPSAPPPAPEPPPPSATLQPLLAAVVTDPTISEWFLLMRDGLEWSEVEQPVTTALKNASKDRVACAYARVHAALEATREEPTHDPRYDPALTSLDAALGNELDARKVDRSKAAAACPADGAP